jgi:hypothetical protein
MTVRVEVQGNAGTIADFDPSHNLFVRRGTSGYGTAGGAFSVSGGPSAMVTTPAVGSLLVSLRHSPAATTNVYITRLRFMISGTAAIGTTGVAGVIGWQRFTNATPSGGTSRTPARKDLSSGSNTQVIDVRDSNVALTATGVNLGEVLSSCILPPLSSSSTPYFYEWVMDLDEDEFYRLTAGDGIGAVIQVANVSSQSWVFSYTIHYLEK